MTVFSEGFARVCTAEVLFLIQMLLKVGNAQAPLEVSTSHAVQTVPLCTAHVQVVPQNIGAYAVSVETPVPQSETGISVQPGA